MTTSRIFIGGIPPGTTNEELVQRFKSFGDVKSCEVVPDKEYPPLMLNSEPMVFTRNFGFITLEPKDEKSLQRAIGVYNGSLWRGCTLRCKLAKPTMMEQLAEEKKEEEEKSKEKVDHTLPLAEEGTTLRIRQANSHELVSVVLGGSELKLEKLANSASQKDHLPSSTKTLQNIVSTPLKPRKTFEQHLRECAERYAASEEGQRAAAARQDRLENTKAAAAQDQETAVNMSLNKDAALATAAGGTNRKGPTSTQATRNLRDAGSGLVHRGQTSHGGSIYPGKRSMDVPLANAPPAQRIRVVDFLSDEDFTALHTQKNISAAVDLSRFGSDSEEEEGEGEGEGEEKGTVTGVKGLISLKKTIPQVDGAADSETTTTSSDDTSSSGTSSGTSSSGTSSSGTSSSSSSESESDSEIDSSDKNKSSSSSSSSSSESESNESGTSSESEESDDENTDTEEQKAGSKGLSKEPDLNGGTSNLNYKRTISDNDAFAFSWMAAYLPAGASFRRQDSVVQVEAAWRAGREAAVREYKERRRQALRQAGKSGGGGTGGKQRKD